MSKPTIYSSPNLTRAQLRTDLDLLLGPSILPHLPLLLSQSTPSTPPPNSFTPKPSDPLTTFTTPTPSETAISVLDDFSVSTARPETSQRLIKAYINTMRREVIPMGVEGGGDKVAGRIDVVREKGEGLVNVLRSVRVDGARKDGGGG